MTLYQFFTKAGPSLLLLVILLALIGGALATNLTLASMSRSVSLARATPILLTTISPSEKITSADLTLDNTPLLIDSEDGWLYTSGRVGDKPQTLVLSAVDGRLVKTYDITGQLELDPVHNWLYVDRGSNGVAVVEAQSGRLQATISLTQSAEQHALQADPNTGQVFVSSDHILYVADPQTGAVIRSIPFNIPKTTCDGLTDDPSPIREIEVDSSHQWLYLSFASFWCTPWSGETLVSFDLAAEKEMARAGYSFPQMTALNGYLYGSDWYRFGIGYRWAWRDGRPWVMTEGWSGGSNTFQVDSKRQRLYESVDGNLRVFDAQSMDLLLALPQPVAGELVGYDPKTDQLYFRDERQLQVWPAAAIEHPQPQSLSPALPPAEPANFLAVSPQWPQDKTLVGLWGYQNLAGDCYVFGQSGGSLFISNDGGNTWGRPSRGLPANCGISTLALSPNYLDDQTILVGVEGWGLFRSTDGGQSWTPSNKGLASVALNQILLSPGFAHDRIAFARSSGALYRSDDGGQSWQLLSTDGKVFLHLVAMSPEFEQDQTLMGATYDYQDNKPRTTLHLSRDGGYHWQQLGQPWDGTIIMLSLGPLFDKWHVVFAFSDNGTLARSSNGGLSWEVVLDTAQRDASAYDLSAQLVFAPNIEVNRPLFFLVTNKVYGSNPDDPPSVQGTLYRSGDGGMTWEEAELPNNIVPTTLAISPTFAQDGRLFLGQADGQVEIMETPIPPNPSGNPHQIISFTAEKTQENGVLLSWEAIGKRAYICPLVDPGTRFDCKTIYDQAYDGKIAGPEIWPADKITAKYTGFRLTVEGANGAVESVEVPISGLSCAHDWFFGNRTKLCPSAPATSFATAQRFEHGQIIWIEKLDQFYIFYDSVQPGPTNLDIAGPLTLKPHASVDNRSGETPPPGYLEPVGNFGLIWRGEVEYLEDVRDRLGWATDPEISFETVYQCGIGDTCNGFSLYMQDPDGKILNLFYVWHFGTYWEEEFNWETYSSEDYGYSIKYPDFLIHSTDTYQRTGGPVTVDKWLPADQNYVISIFSYEDGVNPALEFNGTITDEETIQVAGFEVRKLVGTEAVAQTGALVHIGPVNYREKNQAFVYSSGSKVPPPRSLEIFYQMLETFNFTN